MAVCNICVAIELSNLAVSQYVDWNMQGLTFCNGVGYGGNTEGFFMLDGDDDAGVEIEAHFKLPKTDFGITNQKRVRRLYFGGELYDDMIVTLTADEEDSVDYTLRNAGTGTQQGREIKANRSLKGRYFDVKVANTNGSDFGIDAIDVNLSVLSHIRSN